LAYRPSGGDKLDAWLKTEPDQDVRRRVVLWLMELMRDPGAMEATPVPDQRLPVMTAFVPDTDVAVTFFIADPFHIVQLLRVETVRRG
jgi:hypothetical protein